MLYDIFARVGVAYLEADARRRDNFARFGVLFDDFNERLKGCVIDEEAIGFAVFLNKDIERCKQFLALPALGLLHGVFAVRQILGFGKAVFIAYEDISFGFLGIFIAASRLQIYFKLCTDLRCFNFGAAVIAMLDYSDFTLDNIFEGVERLGTVVFDRVEFCFCADVQALGVQQIPFGGADLTNRPIVAADIILGGKLTVCVGGVGVDELIAFIDAVLCTCEGCIALRQTCSAVALGYGDIELLEDIVKGFVRYLVPFNSGGLLVGNDIASRSVDFLKNISRTDQHILEFCNAVFVGHGILVDFNAGKRCSVEAELHALGQSVDHTHMPENSARHNPLRTVCPHRRKANRVR